MQELVANDLIQIIARSLCKLILLVLLVTTTSSIESILSLQKQARIC